MGLTHNRTPKMMLMLFSVLWSTTWMASANIVFHVAEEEPSGTLVGNVKDASNVTQEVGQDVRDKLQFHILSGDGLRITSIFSINSRTGAIYTNAMIDREQLCDLNPVCKLQFDVTVKTVDSLVKLLTVDVIVDDINDNAPVFPKAQITLTVPESAPLDTQIPISGALDRDAGMNATISYSLQVSSVFGLKEVSQLDGSSALRLVVQKSLDREAVAHYSFLILASDGQGPDALTGTLTVDVVVADVNDNVPKFTKDTFNLTVMETAPVGTIFGHLMASDGDVSDNGRLSYKFSPLTQSKVTELFALNSTSGELSVAASLQYESGRSFRCVVEVMDLGVPPFMSQAILLINVADAGNTPPKLALTLAEPMFGDQSALLSEDVKLGTFVGTLKVEDLDEGEEGQVNCSSLDPHFSLQDLETKRYGIVVSRSLDREEQQEVEVVLICSDSGLPSLTASTTFKVIVRDVNDNAPEFTEDVYHCSVTENASGPQRVTRVSATDRDDASNTALTYFLDPQASADFSIEPQTGIITTRRSFDREATPSLTFTVYARDSATTTNALTGSATVSIKIADLNDNAPYVNRTVYFVSEGTPVGHIFDINVADEDDGLNGTVVMSSLQDDQSPFQVLSNGSILVRSVLDRERQSQYAIAVGLWDNGAPPLSSTATLTFLIVDNNDHAPLFVFPTPGNNSVLVTAEVPVGSQICQINANDGDMGSNGQVVYSIAEGNEGRWFGINNQSGDIFVIRSLVSVAGTALHLRVAASDMGRPPLVSQGLLDIYIQSSNSSLLAGVGSGDPDKYVIIAGVIAGVTFVIAVGVIAVIVHMRNSDLRRRAAAREKAARRDEGSLDNAKKLSVLAQNGIIISDSGNNKPNGGLPDVDTRLCSGQDKALDKRGFQSLNLRDHKDVQHAVGGDVVDSQFDPSFALFAEGRNCLVSEDHNSDISGETTTCDSGRGASDEETVCPMPGKLSGSVDHPPRIPPREPLASLGQWSRDARVVSTNWSQMDPPPYVSEDAGQLFMDDAFDMDSSLPSSSDLKVKGRKGHQKVRFSFDDGDARSQNSAMGHGMDNQAFSNHVLQPDITASHHAFDPNGQPYMQDRIEGHHHPNFQQKPQYANPIAHGLKDRKFSPSHPHGRNSNRFAKELRLNPESLYPRTERFPRKHGAQSAHPGWERQNSNSRNCESLSSLPQSVDDDVSTTTSGSYSIDVDDAMNVSLEC